MQVSLIGSLLRTKKGMALKGFHSILRVVIHKSVFVPDSLTHPAETKKVPKDCHVYTWYPLTLLTILNNVCPGSPVGSRNLPVGTRPADISGMSCLSPFPVYRFRIKINYGSILTQYLVSCQLEYTIYPASVSRFLHPEKFFSFFSKIFSSFCLLPYLYLIDQLFIVAGPPFFDN